MTTDIDEARKEQIARRQVQALTAFYVHAAIYVIVIAGLTAIDYAGGRGWWVHWVAGGWGIGLLAHGLAVYAGKPRALRDWQERKVEEIKSRQ